MKKAPEIGDLATALLYVVPARAVRGKVVGITGNMDALLSVDEIASQGPFVRIELPEGTAQRRLSREGFSWIRGHHAEDSIEVKALLAAEALERGS